MNECISDNCTNLTSDLICRDCNNFYDRSMATRMIDAQLSKLVDAHGLTQEHANELHELLYAYVKGV